VKLLYTALIACSLLSLQPAYACSFSWAPGYSPKRIPHREDVWRVKGDFKVIDATTGKFVEIGEALNLTSDTGEMLGQIERKGRKPIKTRQYFYEEWAIACRMVLTPQGPTSGTFWMEKERDKQGRYRLLMWRPEKQRPNPEAVQAVPVETSGKQ
jgi:hypothetical protein